MAFNVRFNFVDSYNTKTSRTFHTLAPDLATLITDIAALSAAIQPLTEGGIISSVGTYVDQVATFGADAGSNVDENMSVNAQGSDGYIYDVDLPMPVGAIINSDRTLDIGNAQVAAFFALFAAGANWRVNVRNPVDITQLIGGKLDK